MKLKYNEEIFQIVVPGRVDKSRKDERYRVAPPREWSSRIIRVKGKRWEIFHYVAETTPKRLGSLRSSVGFKASFLWRENGDRVPVDAIFLAVAKPRGTYIHGGNVY